MPVLAVGVVVAARWRLDRTQAALVVGLIASATGDTALLRSGEGAFVLGTLWFAMAHVCYIAAFANAGRGRGLVRRRPWLVLPYALVWLGGAVLLGPHLGALRIVVVAYSALLTVMAVCALDLFDRLVRRAAASAAARDADLPGRAGPHRQRPRGATGTGASSGRPAMKCARLRSTSARMRRGATSPP